MKFGLNRGGFSGCGLILGLAAAIFSLLGSQTSAGPLGRMIFGARGSACGPAGCSSTAGIYGYSGYAGYTSGFGGYTVQSYSYQATAPMMVPATTPTAPACVNGFCPLPARQAVPQATAPLMAPQATAPQFVPQATAPQAPTPIYDPPVAPPARPASFAPAVYAPTAPANVTAAVGTAMTNVVAPTMNSDPYGFVGWLNGVRARHGLRAVRHDARLAGWARQNNHAQARVRVSSHHVNPNCFQCAFVGPRTAQDAGAGWLASPSHASILLNPSIQVVGIDGFGDAWTMNAL